MTVKRVIIAFIITAAAAGSGYASYAPSDTVSVLWDEGTVASVTRYDAAADEQGLPVDYAASSESLSRARMAAYSSAKENAKELIATALRSIQADGKTDIGTILDTDPITQESVSRLLDTKISSKEHPSGFMEACCSASLKLSDLAAALPFDFPEEQFPVGIKNALATEYTSLIIDVRGKGVEPMIFPSVYDQDGLEIYGRRYVLKTTACSKGIVHWCRNEKAARALPIAGQHPYYTAALSSVNGSPVVSRTDSRRILAHKRTLDRLRKCAVIFIIDIKEKKAEGMRR
jgi:hypothetical protein